MGGVKLTASARNIKKNFRSVELDFLSASNERSPNVSVYKGRNERETT